MKLIRLLKKRGKSGFTLVEVVISCVLLGILILGVFSVVTPIISGVKSREQSANALMLGEAAEAYIDRSIKNSVFVAIFENGKPDDMKADDKIAKSKQMEEMLAFINNADNKDAAGNDIYELKCIGIRWKYDAKSQQYKYMITNEIVDKTTGAVDISPSTSKSYDVFETCFYENLYPEFTFDIMETVVVDEDGNPTTDPPTMQEVPAIKTTVSVHRDADMQEMAFQGTGYADLTNIKRQQTTGFYKLFSKKGILNADGTYVADTETVLRAAPDPDDDSLSEEDKHLETYIYYVTRKLKATTSPAPSSTSSTSSTSSSSTT